MKEFTTPTRKPSTATFVLDGRTFTFTAPKDALILTGLTDASTVLAQSRVVLDWLGAGLSTEDGQHILDRLNDPDDDLDVDTLVEVIQHVAGEVAARPTKP